MGTFGLLNFFSTFIVLCCSESVAIIDAQTANERIHAGHIYLDVRTVEEFDKGHVENALNVPYLFFTPEGKIKNPKFIDQVSAIVSKEDHHLIVGCLGGVRSLQASSDLLAAGYKNVENFGGGYISWVEHGFSVHVPPQNESKAVDEEL